MSAVTDDNSILGSSAMVTSPQAAQIEAIHLYKLSNFLISQHVFTLQERTNLDMIIKEMIHAEKHMKIKIRKKPPYNNFLSIAYSEVWV